MSDRAHHIARLCEHLDELRRYAQRAGLGLLVDALVAGARDGQDIGARLTDLMRRLDGPEDALPVRGLPTLPGLGDGHTAAEVYGCPAGRCSRTWPRQPGGSIPVCHIDRTRLCLASG